MLYILETRKSEEIALHYIKISKYVNALKEVENLLLQNPKKAYYLYLRSDCLYYLDRYDESLTEIKRALEEGYSAEICNELMGRIYWSMKNNYYPAQKCFEEVLRINPNNAETLVEYGYMLYELHKELHKEGKGGQFIKDALKMAPNNSVVLHYAFYYYKYEKDKKETKCILEKYLECSGNEIGKLEKLGDYELFLKHYKQAKEHYKQAFLLNPTNKYIHRKITIVDLERFTLGLPINKIAKFQVYIFLALLIICAYLSSCGFDSHSHIFNADYIFRVLIWILIITRIMLEVYICIYNKIYASIMKRRGF